MAAHASEVLGLNHTSNNPLCQPLLLLRLLSTLGTRLLFFSSFLQWILVSYSSFIRWTKYDAHTANNTHSHVEGFRAFPFCEDSRESVKRQPSVPLWQDARCFSPFLRMLAIMSWLVPRDGGVRPNCVAVIHTSWSSDAFDSREFGRKRSGSVYEARKVPGKNLPPLLRYFFNYARVWWLAWMAFCAHANLLATFSP